MSGKETEGIVGAVSEAAVVGMIREKNQYPVSIKEYRKEKTGIFIGNPARKVRIRDLAVFCRQFSTVVNAGVPILTGLDILRRQTENQILRAAVDDLYKEVQKGNSLSSVMGMHKGIFPELLVNMVEAGEVSGTLDSVMEKMADHYEREHRVNHKVKNALVYPSLIAIVAALVVIFMVTVVLPTFVSMFEDMGAVLPLPTRMLISLGGIITGRWFLLLTAALGLYTAFKICSRSARGKELLDTVGLRAPVIGSVYKKMITARFARTLGALMSSGIPMLEGIEIAGKVVGNTVVRKGLYQVEDNIKKGKGLAQPLSNIEVFPPMLIQMVEVGEDTGTLDYILAKTADVFDDEVENAVSRMTTMLEPAIIVAMAVVVGFIVVSIALPMFDMLTNISF
jgi:type IV pilus assembly protein PilC